MRIRLSVLAELYIWARMLLPVIIHGLCMFRLFAKPSVGAPSLLQTSRTEPKPRKLLYAIAEFGPLHHRLHNRDFRLRQTADIEPGSP